MNNTEAFQRTVADIQKMDFSTMVGVVNEPNTPSGARDTIRRIVQQMPIDQKDAVLDVGCNTGFATLEFARWTSAQVTGIDLNETSLEFARTKALQAGIGNARFQNANALQLPFEDGYFDVVYVNNVTSFISKRQEAAVEYSRVLKPFGVLAVVPIYYYRQPPAQLHRDVEIAIGAELPIRGKDYWYDCFSNPDYDLFFDEDYEYIHQSSDRIQWYVSYVLDQPHLTKLPSDIYRALADRLRYFYELFNENLTYARYCILLYKKYPAPPEPILFETRRITTG